MQEYGPLLKVARVLLEDDELLIIEVGKTDDVTWELRDGDQFMTLLFVRSDGKGGTEVWDPGA